MIFHDARDRTAETTGRTLARMSALSLKDISMQTLGEFLRSVSVSALSRADKETICDQAILILDQFYPHLPFKRARYAIDPVQRMRLVRAQCASLSDSDFHCAMLGAFAELNDVHTFYRLPPPFQGAIAFLPFFVQSYWEAGQRRFVVTDVLDGFAPRNPPHEWTFERGVEVTHWNGRPIGRAVEQLAEQTPGGNAAAKFARALLNLTVRPLGISLPPDEEFVFVRYLPLRSQRPNEDHIIAVDWTVGTGMGTDLLFSQSASICKPLAELSAARKVLWNTSELAAEHQTASEDTLVSVLPRVFQVQTAGGTWSEGNIHPDSLAGEANKKFGYLRIKTFDGDKDDIVREFQRLLGILQEKAGDGLILDVRSNPGGNVEAAERLLQCLTPKRIAPAAFHFANTPALQAVLSDLQNLDLLANVDRIAQIESTLVLFEDWFADAIDEVSSGNPLTPGRAVTNPRDANSLGQIYQGPVALLTDAMSYSATDIFAAGFQDHAIGPIIGVHTNTGGGGAIRFLHGDDLVNGIKQTLPHMPFEALPGGCEMGVAFQRSARMAAHAGQALEDTGVVRDIAHDLTRQDLMNASVDVIRAACAILGKQPAYRLAVTQCSPSADGIHVQLDCKGLVRVVCFIDDHAQIVRPATSEPFLIATEEGSAQQGGTLRVDGYSRISSADGTPSALQLVASARFSIAASRTTSA